MIDFDGLQRLIDEINMARRAREPHPGEHVVDGLFGAARRLAVYGAAAGGGTGAGAGAGVMGANPFGAAVAGFWRDGYLRGRLDARGWAAMMGHPGLELDPFGDRISARMLTSDALPAAWKGYDAFEGRDYRRLLTLVEDDAGPIGVANVYALTDG